MVEPVTVGTLVAETLSVAAKAGLNGEAGEAVKDGYKALKEKVSHWASSDVVALEATLGSIDRQVVIAKIIDAQSEEDRTSLRVLAEALVTKLKECAPAVGLDIGRLTALEAQLAADDTEQPAQADGGGTTKEANAPNGSDKSAADDASPATTEQVEALFKFRKILTELVSRTTDNLDNKESPSSARNPFVILVRPFGRLVRWFQREPGFEETVANYASMLPILETSSGWRYSEVALIGIMALQAGKLEVAKTVNAEVRFQTTTSAALGPVIEGVGFIVLCLVILSAIVAGLSATIGLT